MKRVIAVFALVLLAATSFAQNGLNNVMLHGTFSPEQSTIQVMLAGPGANDVAAMDLVFSNGVDCRICTTTIMPMGKSGGNSWTASGPLNVVYTQVASPAGDPDIPYRYVLEIGGIARIQHNNGNISSWGFLFQLGTGTRTTTGQASTKAELL